MSYEKWVDNARDQVDQLSGIDNEAVRQADWLLTSSADQGIEFDPAMLPYVGEMPDINADNFLVLNRTELMLSGVVPDPSGRLKTERILAFVAHYPDLPSLMVLPSYNPHTKVTNAAVYLHELVHISEKQSGLYRPDLEGELAQLHDGERERAAYKLNRGLIEAADGSDYRSYVANWPIRLAVVRGLDGTDVNLSFLEEQCPVPPAETLMHAMWSEGKRGQALLRVIGRMAALENAAAELPAAVTSGFVAKMTAV